MHDDMAQIYHQLKNGTGHELVTEENVQELIRMAEQYGNERIETLLREWHSNCGDDNSSPVRRGFPPSSPMNHPPGGRAGR
jgi:hypothetical protein